MRNTLLLFLALAVLALVGVRPSTAQSGDCTDEYVRSFDVPAIGGEPRWSAGRIQCQEYFDVAVNTPDGEVSVRGIGDINIAASLPPGGIEAIEAGVRRAGERLSTIGDFDLDDTVILIASPRASPTDPQPRFGYSNAWTVPGTDRAREYVECHVTLFADTTYTADELHYIVAHELFHCVQKATLTEAQNATQSGRGLWWIEGSAEWFAAWAIGPQPRWQRGRRFTEQVAAGEALHGMSYRMAVFFYWLHETQGGATAIIPFLHQMSEGAAPVAQEIAMQRALGAEQWLEFAQAFDDRRIRYPGGGAVDFGQQVEGEEWRITESSQHQRPLKAFTIGLGWADYDCGRWENGVTEANLEVRREDSEAWSAWPNEIDTRDSAGANGRYRVIGLITNPGEEIDFRLDATRREACTECQTEAVIDQCLVGTWEQVSGGPMEFLQRQGIPEVVRNNIGKLVMTMRDDGTFATQSVPVDYELLIPDDEGPILSDAIGGIAPSRGRWSAEGGRLAGCFDAGGEFSGTVSMTRRGRTVRIPPPTQSYAGIGGTSNYSCNDTTLVTTSPMPSGDTMTYEFRRVTPRRR
jgi:hypothetical protein